MGCSPVRKDIKVESKTKGKNDISINIMGKSDENESTNTYKNSSCDSHSSKKDTLDNYSIIQKFNTKVENSFKVMSKIKQEIFVMKIIQKLELKTLNYLQMSSII